MLVQGLRTYDDIVKIHQGKLPLYRGQYNFHPGLEHPRCAFRPNAIRIKRITP